MPEIRKNYVTDENQNPIAVQIPIEEFQKIEEILENFGLMQLMNETESEESLSEEDALLYYQSLDKNVAD